MVVSQHTTSCATITNSQTVIDVHLIILIKQYVTPLLYVQIQPVYPYILSLQTKLILSSPHLR
jgi:hypothetical protein